MKNIHKLILNTALSSLFVFMTTIAKSEVKENQEPIDTDAIKENRIHDVKSLLLQAEFFLENLSDTIKFINKEHTRSNITNQEYKKLILQIIKMLPEEFKFNGLGAYVINNMKPEFRTARQLDELVEQIF